MASYSNCVIEAVRAVRALRRQGVRAYLWARGSDFRWSPFHMGWAVYDSATRMLRVFSFRPLNGRDVPLYMAWTRLLFRGQVVEHDDPPPADGPANEPTAVQPEDAPRV